jgi:hypothetical protein
MDVFPAQFPKLLGPSAGQQGDDDVGVHSVGGGEGEHLIGLFRRPRPTTLTLSRRHLGECYDIPLHQIQRLRPSDGAVQTGMGTAERL